MEEKQPWMTASFYEDGTVKVESGKGVFPTDPEAILKSNGAVLQILWQVAFHGFQGMQRSQKEINEAYTTLTKILDRADEGQSH